MTDETDEARLARMRDEVFNAVLDRGFLIHYVPADVASLLHENRPYAYTVGRTLMQRPEFLVTGLPSGVAKPVLDALVAYDDRRHPSGQRPSAEALAGTFARLDIELLFKGGSQDPWRDVQAPGPVRMKLILADPHPMIGALTEFGLDKVRAIQALWPRDGGYPDVNDRWRDQPIHPYGRTPLSRRDPYPED